MERIKVFLLMLIAASAGLATSLVALTAISEREEGLTAVLVELLEGHVPSGVPFFVPISTLLFFSTVLASTVGVIYFIVVPEIEDSRSQAAGRGGVDAIIGYLLPDERAVVEVLIRHDGVYLQKYIAKEAGLSRLRTHRAVARLAERGIVSTTRVGNTNEVRLLVGRGSDGGPSTEGPEA